jgi:ankyrin repeat protein
VSIINDLLKGKGYNNESNEIKGMECIRSVWQSLAKSSLIERTFIHGRHMVQAVRDMTALLSGVSIEAFPSKPMIDNAHVILTAIRVGDLTIADAGTAKLQKSTVEHKISEDDKNLLMLSCTITACSGAFSNLEAFQLLEFALSRGCSIDCNLGGATGPRPVITAIEHQRGDILDFFIERGANVNLRDDQGKCPLHYLVRSELSTTYPVTKLLDAGADVNAREIPGNTSRTSENSDSSTVDTPLILAIKALKLEEAKLLIRDPSIDPTILSGGYSPLHWAVKTGRLDLVSLVIEMPNKSGQSRQTTDTGRGALLRQRDKDGNTPMLLAALGGKVKLVEYFLDKGADLTATNYSGFSCLHCAAYGLHTELLEFLVGKMDPNSSAAPPFESPHEVEFEGEIIGVSSTNSSCTAYRYEAALNLVVKQRSAKLVAPYTACCTILIKAGADPTIPDETGSNPLEIIGRRIEELDEAQSNNVRRSLLEAMVKKGVDLNYMSDGRTWRSCLLHQALNEVDVALVQDLLELGANPEIVNTSSEMTPLRRCASVGPKTSFAMPGALLEKFCKIASLLIAAGADIYERDAERLTLLACAVVEENGPMVHLLLGHFKSMIDLDSLDAESSAGPAKDNSQIPQASLSMPTSKKKGGMRASMLKTIKSAAKPKQDVPVLDTRPARSKVMLERRFRGMSAINREIILDAWRLATSRNRWDVISAFIDQDLHGDTESLKMPTGLALLRYALDQEIGSVLIKFMGKTEGHLSDEMEMDPHLADIWAWVCGWPRSRREVDLGQHLLARCDQFIKAKGFVPMLDLSALQGKGYWEGYTFGGEGGTMKEAIPTEGPTSTPVVYNIFASENFEETEEEMQVQAQLDSLLGGWRGKLGQRSRDG